MSRVASVEGSAGAGVGVGERRPQGGVSGTAAVLLLTARAVVGVSAAELARAAGCGVSLVADIEAGRVDPCLDTVERLVNSVGLEVRAGGHRGPNPSYMEVTSAEVERVRVALEERSEFRRAYGIRPVGPPPGTQPEWDGQGHAPARCFGAGPTRRDEGGWSAILVSSQRALARTTLDDLAEAAGISTECAASIENGTFRPPVTLVEALVGAMGVCLAVRLEPYDDHDDGLHLQALADPELYQRRLEHAKKVFSTAAALD